MPRRGRFRPGAAPRVRPRRSPWTRGRAGETSAAFRATSSIRPASSIASKRRSMRRPRTSRSGDSTSAAAVREGQKRRAGLGPASGRCLRPWHAAPPRRAGRARGSGGRSARRFRRRVRQAVAAEPLGRAAGRPPRPGPRAASPGSAPDLAVRACEVKSCSADDNRSRGWQGSGQGRAASARPSRPDRPAHGHKARCGARARSSAAGPGRQDAPVGEDLERVGVDRPCRPAPRRWQARGRTSRWRSARRSARARSGGIAAMMSVQRVMSGAVRLPVFPIEPPRVFRHFAAEAKNGRTG